VKDIRWEGILEIASSMEAELGGSQKRSEDDLLPGGKESINQGVQ
jgi:hypothetical protein